MIKVYLYKGDALINPSEISHIKEAGASSAWHGIRTYITMNTGETLECQHTLSELERKMDGLQ